MILKPGLVIEQYRIESRLGVGGMAEVWQVRHETLHTAQALKVLTRTTPALTRRLLREGRAQATLRHDNLLPVHDVLDVFGRPGLLMPLVEGPSLSALLEGYRPDRAEALALLHAVLSALEAVHVAGLVHRDVKPGNVLLSLTPDGLTPLLSDFGLVKVNDAVKMTQTGQVFGTPAYAAPEQLRDASDTDHRADLFSLGALLVELLTGHRPFPGDNLARIIDAHGHPPRLDGLDGGLHTLAAALLAVDPALRPADAAAVRAALPAAGDVLGTDTPIYRAAQASWQTPEAPTADETFASVAFDTTSLVAAASNLPTPAGPFIARAADLEQLSAWLAEGRRLLTLTGVGGSGKTRLALEVGHQTLPRWPGGAWFCDLTEARDRTGLAAAISRALQIPLGSRPVDQISAWIGQRGQTLLILDNFEQIIGEGAELVGALLDRTPDLHLLVTSREPLRLAGEQRLAVEPLSVSDGAALFLSRARAVDATFAPGSHDDVEALVRLLDGLPLAIELAAARCRMLSPQAMIKRLSDRFRFLRSRDRDATARQRTLQATLQWSWDLLTPGEQSALAQLSVFEGGFTVEAAEDVVALPEDCDEWVEDVLAELLDKSLLTRALQSASGTRLSMLVSVQEFAARQLSEDERAAAERRHGTHFTGLSRERQPVLSPVSILTDQGARLAEQDNIVAACRRALRRSDAHTAVACGLSAAALYSRRGPFEQGARLLKTLSALPSLSARETVSLAIQRGWLQLAAGDLDEGQEVLRSAVDLAEAEGLADLLPLMLLVRGNLNAHRGNLETATADVQRALDLALERGDARVESQARGQLGYIMVLSGRVIEARKQLEEALGLLTAGSGDRSDEGMLLSWLGQACGWGGDIEASLTALHHALQLHRQQGNLFQEAVTLIILGDILSRGVDLDAAEKHLTRCLTLCSAIDFLTAEGACYGVLARVTAHRGDFETARTQLDAASARLNTLSTRILHLQQLYNRLEVEHLAGNELGVGMTIMGIKQVADALGLSEQAWFLEQIQQFLSR